MLDRSPAKPCAAAACRPARARPATPRRPPPRPGDELRAAAERHGLVVRPRAVVAPANDPALPPRAAVAPANDPAEAAADRLAGQALAAPAPARCSCGGTPGPDGECAACRTRRLRAQAAARAQVVAPTLGTPGRPLDAATRGFFEPRLGADLSGVRIHTGDRAAASAESLGARAFAVGSEVVFGAGEYAPGTPAGQRLLAHELAHVVQDGGGPPVVRRLVRERNVTCRNTGLHGGVPGGVISGADAVATIQAADERAIDLIARAEAMLMIQRLTHGTALYTADADFDAALMNRFGLSLADPAHHRTIEIIEHELATVRRYLQSGNVRYMCRGDTCTAGDWARAAPGTGLLKLCNPFWNAGSLNQQGATIMHEALHLWWDQIWDQGHRPLHNAHCFEQFALDIAGASADILPEFAGACVV